MTEQVEEEMELWLADSCEEVTPKARKELRKMLVSLDQHGWPDGFCNADVEFGFNKHSGYVFFINCDNQIAMLGNGDKLELYREENEGGVRAY
jgi:hypothetical protein